MNPNKKRYQAKFTLNDAFIRELENDDKDDLIAKCLILLESDLKNTTCRIIDAQTNKVIQTLKCNSIE